MLIPREYQLEALDAVESFRKQGITRQLISLPTGTGKTIVFSLLARRLNAKTLLIAHREELLSQAADKFSIVWPEVNVGVVKADVNQCDRCVVVASIQTACQPKRLAQLKECGFELCIIDEAHHAVADSYVNVIRELGFFDPAQPAKTDGRPSKLLLGVTATPERGDKIGLYPIFQKIVFERSLETMIRGGYLSPLLGLQVVTRIDIQGVEVQAGDFVISQLSKILNTPDRNQIIVENFKKYASDRKRTLAFCCDVKHSKDLAEAFSNAGVKASYIHGAMTSDERKGVLRDFATGAVKLLANCQILTEGYDQADIDCILLGRPTYSQSLYMQMIGRGARLHPDKNDCLVIDFTDNCVKHTLCFFKNTLKGAVTPYFGDRFDDVIGLSVESAQGQIVEKPVDFKARFKQASVQEIEFFQKAHFAWASVGDSWHLQLANDRDVWVRQVEGGFLVVGHENKRTIALSNWLLPLDYALGVAEDWARSQTTKSAWARKDAAWRSEPATPKQMSALQKCGVHLDYGISRGDASQLLDSKINEPATEKQKHFLRKRGFRFDANITKTEAYRIIKEQVGNL